MELALLEGPKISEDEIPKISEDEIPANWECEN